MLNQEPTAEREVSQALSTSERILLESACVDTIGQMEQLLEKASGEKAAGFLGESILIANQMLLLIVDFSEGYLAEHEQGSVFERTALGYAATQRGVALSSSQTWGAIRKLIGQETATDNEVANAHQEVGAAVASAAESAVQGAVRMLGADSVVALQLVESLDPMLEELRTEW